MVSRSSSSSLGLHEIPAAFPLLPFPLRSMYPLSARFLAYMYMWDVPTRPKGVLVGEYPCFALEWHVIDE
jgi:hypothetical protein